jgi:hypothetical protein
VPLFLPEGCGLTALCCFLTSAIGEEFWQTACFQSGGSITLAGEPLGHVVASFTLLAATLLGAWTAVSLLLRGAPEPLVSKNAGPMLEGYFSPDDEVSGRSCGAENRRSEDASPRKASLGEGLGTSPAEQLRSLAGVVALLSLLLVMDGVNIHEGDITCRVDATWFATAVFSFGHFALHAANTRLTRMPFPWILPSLPLLVAAVCLLASAKQSYAGENIAKTNITLNMHANSGTEAISTGNFGESGSPGFYAPFSGITAMMYAHELLSALWQQISDLGESPAVLWITTHTKKRRK